MTDHGSGGASFKIGSSSGADNAGVPALYKQIASPEQPVVFHSSNDAKCEIASVLPNPAFVTHLSENPPALCGYMFLQHC